MIAAAAVQRRVDSTIRSSQATTGTLRPSLPLGPRQRVAAAPPDAEYCTAQPLTLRDQGGGWCLTLTPRARVRILLGREDGHAGEDRNDRNLGSESLRDEIAERARSRLSDHSTWNDHHTVSIHAKDVAGGETQPVEIHGRMRFPDAGTAAAHWHLRDGEDAKVDLSQCLDITHRAANEDASPTVTLAQSSHFFSEQRDTCRAATIDHQYSTLPWSFKQVPQQRRIFEGAHAGDGSDGCATPAVRDQRRATHPHGVAETVAQVGGFGRPSLRRKVCGAAHRDQSSEAPDCFTSF